MPSTILRPHLPEYTTTVEIGACEMQIGVDYSFEPGLPAIPPSLSGPGEPPEGPTAYIGDVFWRADDERAPWQAASAALTALLIDAIGGEDALVDELCAHAEGLAESAAYDRADAMRATIMEAAE